MNQSEPFMIGPRAHPWRWGIVASVAIVCVFAVVPNATVVMAQTPDAAVSDQTSGSKIPTVIELFQSSQTSVIINSILLGFSVLSMLLWLFLMMGLSTRGFCPQRFVENVSKDIGDRQFEQAVHLCQNHSGLFTASIIQRMVENRDKDHASLIEILSAEGRRKAEPIWNRINYLAEIANIAPMLGLLGTVLGMIKVFFELTGKVDAGTDRAAQLAGGIGEALGTTMFGLIVAITSGIFYTLARSRATAVLAEAEQVCHQLADQTARVAVDPRLKKIDALADAARQKIAMASSRGNVGGPGSQPGASTPSPRPPVR